MCTSAFKTQSEFSTDDAIQLLSAAAYPVQLLLQRTLDMYHINQYRRLFTSSVLNYSNIVEIT